MSLSFSVLSPPSWWRAVPAPPAPPTSLDLAAIIGPGRWRQLPFALWCRFAPRHRPACYRGTMDLERSAAGFCFAFLARAFGAPLPLGRGSGLPTEVRVHEAAGGVVWERDFRPGWNVRSIKLPGPGNTVLERTDGGLGMVLDVTVEDGALVFTSKSFFLSLGRWRVPVPLLFAPGRCRVEHRALDDECFRFTLTMTHPLLGETFRQSGIFTDQPETAP